MSNKQPMMRVTVADPWDFTSATGSSVFEAHIAERIANGALLHFTTHIEFGGRSWEWFAAFGPSSDCTLYGVSDDTRQAWADAERNWRGHAPAARAQLASM